jgi:hypothetical protein
MSTLSQPAADRQWYIVGRWQEFEGEGRANVLRMIAVGVFYGLQLVQFHFFAIPGESEQRFHRAATALAAVGVLVSLGVQLCLRRRFFPAFLKYVSTGTDIVLITGAAMLGSGAYSPIRVAYFVVIALATLRFSLPLVWCASLGTMAGYLALVGATDTTWFDADHTVPPIEQLLMLASLALTGVVMGQVIRRVRGMAEGFAERQSGMTKRGNEQ